MTIPRTAAILVVVLLLAAPLQGQAIRGKVIIPAVQPPDRVEVLLEKSDGQVIQRAYTDSQGNFEMRGMPTGAYEVVVRVEGYNDTRLRVDVLPPAQGSTIVNIPLERPTTRFVPAPVDSVIDVADLNRNYPRRVLQEYERALEDNREGNSARALERLGEVLRSAPDFYGAHILQGRVYQKLERFTDAEKSFKRAQELNPRAAQPLIELGSLYIQEADAPSTDNNRRLRGRILDDALDVLEEATRLDTHSVYAHYFLGLANYRSSFFPEAEAALMRTLVLESRMAPARLVLINLYIRWEKWQNAIDQVDIYLAENPRAPNREELATTRSKVLERLNSR